ncbi:MAG: hypothetical protein V7L04_06705 [Nostoc sp.]
MAIIDDSRLQTKKTILNSGGR